MAKQPISKLEYEILRECIVDEPFSIVIAGGLLEEGYRLNDIISALVRLVAIGYLTEIDQLEVSESALLEYVAKREAAGEDTWNEWPGVVEEYNFLNTDKGNLCLKPDDRPIPLFEHVKSQVGELKKQGHQAKEAQTQGLLDSNAVLRASGITKEQLKELGLS